MIDNDLEDYVNGVLRYFHYDSSADGRDYSLSIERDAFGDKVWEVYFAADLPRDTTELRSLLEAPGLRVVITGRENPFRRGTILLKLGDTEPVFPPAPIRPPFTGQPITPEENMLGILAVFGGGVGSGGTG